MKPSPMPTIDDLLRIVAERNAEITRLTALKEQAEWARDDAISRVPTDQPTEGHGALMLNAYGRRCYVTGQHSRDAEVAAVREKYDELIYAVANKYPGETRHETALRYIRQAEVTTLNSSRPNSAKTDLEDRDAGGVA